MAHQYLGQAGNPAPFQDGSGGIEIQLGRVLFLRQGYSSGEDTDSGGPRPRGSRRIEHSRRRLYPPGVVCMPPMFINIGAYVDEGTMVDSHALVGSCAQIGKRVHLSAAAQIGGVLEPPGALPVIVEDDAFVGGNCGVYEGVIVGARAVLAA